jgi:hypothetical protein
MNGHYSQEELSAYADGELHADRIRLVSEHCAECAECRVELGLIEKVRKLVVESDPAIHARKIDLEHVVMRRIRTEQAVRGQALVSFSWRWAAMAACAVVAVVGLFVIVPRLGEDLSLEYVEVENIEDFSLDQPEDWLVAAASGEEDIELIIATLMPEYVVDSEVEFEDEWMDSTVDELVDDLTETEIEDLRKELYNYATQG